MHIMVWRSYSQIFWILRLAKFLIIIVHDATLFEKGIMCTKLDIYYKWVDTLAGGIFGVLVSGLIPWLVESSAY